MRSDLYEVRGIRKQITAVQMENFVFSKLRLQLIHLHLLSDFEVVLGKGLLYLEVRNLVCEKKPCLLPAKPSGPVVVLGFLFGQESSLSSSCQISTTDFNSHVAII